MKKLITLVLIGALAASLTACSTKNESLASNSSVTSSSAASSGSPAKETTEPRETEIETTEEPTTEKVTEKPTEKPTEAISTEYSNALESAEGYLLTSSFSKEGLRDQLKFEKYSSPVTRTISKTA